MSRAIVPTHLAVVLAAGFLLLAARAPAWAASAAQRKGEACAAIDDPTARLACFDAAFPRGSRAAAPRAPAPVTAATPPTATVPAAPAAAAPTASAARPQPRPLTEAQKFGLSAQQREALERKPDTPPPVKSTTAIVKSVRKLPSGYLRIELDNDQVWQQIETDPNVWLEPGEQVTIRRASLGSYLLDTPRRYSTRVQRVQ